jgi:hypothetical protein
VMTAMTTSPEPFPKQGLRDKEPLELTCDQDCLMIHIFCPRPNSLSV